MENKKCISYGLEHKTGVIVSHCYQCGKCTAGCVLAVRNGFSSQSIGTFASNKDC